MTVQHLDERRYLALAGYTRQPWVLQVVQEFAWFATVSERVLGVLTWDRRDYDFGWIALARDERRRFRAINVNASLPSAEAAEVELRQAMERYEAEPDDAFKQGDDEAAPIDFFAPRAPPEAWHPSFRLLIEDPRYSPARELIAAMMRYHEDVDGNFVEQFQTVAFDARIWELYLFALFTELGYARNTDFIVPDFVLDGFLGGLGVEASTANPAQGHGPPPMDSKEAFTAYLENYIPIKLARALKKKMRKRQPYWEEPAIEGRPFVIALQDFHSTASMRMIAPAAVELMFGVRHSLLNGVLHVERIKEHRLGKVVEPSAFFFQPQSEHVSAVLLNPQGTLMKFNRLGLIAGFGHRHVRMTRVGMRRYDDDLADPRPRPFREEVHAPDYKESWVEGAIVLHNPNARIRLDPALVLGATHEFLQPDGRIITVLPGNPPYFSSTLITLEGEDEPSSTEVADEQGAISEARPDLTHWRPTLTDRSPTGRD